MQIHGIGELILRTREERGISQKELACGLCEQQKLSSIEMGNDLPDTFLLEAFMSRMGKSADKLEYVISEEEYKFYVLRDSIEEALGQEQYREVEQKLAEYEGYLMEEDVLHFQYLDMVQAFLVWTEEQKKQEAIAWLESAMDRTMPFWREEGIWGHAASWLEAGLFLLWADRTKEEEERSRFFERMLAYIEEQWLDEEEKVKIYPFTALLYCRRLIREKKYQQVQELCKKAIRLLTENNTISNLLELLKLRIIALQELAGKEKELERLIRQKDALEAIEKEYFYKVFETSIFTKVKRELYLDREIIRKNRKAMGITQEKLSDGICTQETLARIEGGRKAREKNFQRLAERVSWKKEKRTNEIGCWDYVLLEKKREIDWLASRYRNQEAKEKLLAFPCPATIEGQQYVSYMMAMLELQLKEREPEEVLKLLEEALKMTLKLKDWTKIKDYVLAKQEILILNGMGIAYAQMGQKKKAIELYEDIMEGYRQSKIAPVFQAYGMLTVLGNLALYLEEEDCFEEALRQLEKKIQLELSCRRVGGVGKILVDAAYTMERQNTQGEKRKQMYIQAYYLLDLMQENVTKGIVFNHFKVVYGEEIEVEESCCIK
ncbi:MAG: hypothetical protein ACOCM8_01325 [Acetivibrio ethanolgignens]